MKTGYFVLFFLLTSCCAGKKSNVGSLAAQLEEAEQELLMARRKVSNLQVQLYQGQIAAIRKKIEFFDRSDCPEDPSALFQEERKSLTAMMEKEGEVKKEAQEVLNLILRLITVLNSESH